MLIDHLSLFVYMKNLYMGIMKLGEYTYVINVQINLYIYILYICVAYVIIEQIPKPARWARMEDTQERQNIVQVRQYIIHGREYIAHGVKYIVQRRSYIEQRTQSIVHGRQCVIQRQQYMVQSWRSAGIKRLSFSCLFLKWFQLKYSIQCSTISWVA